MKPKRPARNEAPQRVPRRFGSLLRDLEKHTQLDTVCKTELLGLDGTKDIALAGKQLQDAPKRSPQSK